MKLFTVPKIPVYCEGISHRLERRKDHDIKVVDLALKIEPFTPQLAAALDPAEYGFVKRTLFKMTEGAEPVVDLKSVEFRAPRERQNLHAFAAPDVPDASMFLEAVKITKIRARKSKDGSGWTLYVYVSFGPLSADELAWVNQFYSAQTFITFDETDPSLQFDEPAKTEAKAAKPASRPMPGWDDGEPPPAAQAEESEEAREKGSRPTAKRHRTKESKAAAQRASKANGAAATH